MFHFYHNLTFNCQKIGCVYSVPNTTLRRDGKMDQKTPKTALVL